MTNRLLLLSLFPGVASGHALTKTGKSSIEDPLETFNRPCAVFDDARTVESLKKFEAKDSLSAECDANAGSGTSGLSHRWITVGHVSGGKKECREYAAFQNADSATEKDWEDYADSGCLAVHRATAGKEQFDKCMRSKTEGFFNSEWPHVAILLDLTLSGEKKNVTAAGIGFLQETGDDSEGDGDGDGDSDDAPDSASDSDDSDLDLESPPEGQGEGGDVKEGGGGDADNVSEETDEYDGWTPEEIRERMVNQMKGNLESLWLQKRVVDFSQSALNNKRESLKVQMDTWIKGLRKRLVPFNVTDEFVKEKWEQKKRHLKRDFKDGGTRKDMMLSVMQDFTWIANMLTPGYLSDCLLDNWDAFHGLRCMPATIPSVGYSGLVSKDADVEFDRQDACKCRGYTGCAVTESIPYHPAIIRWGVGKAAMYFGNRWIEFGPGFLNHQVVARLSAEEVCRNKSYSGICWLFSFCARWEAAKGQMAMLRTTKGSVFSIAQIKWKMWWMDGWIAAKLNPIDVVRKGVQYLLPANLKTEWWTQDL